MQVLHRNDQACECLSEINSLVISDFSIEKILSRVQYFFAQRCCAVFRVQSTEFSCGIIIYYRIFPVFYRGPAVRGREKKGWMTSVNESDGAVVFLFFMATGVALHNYLPLLTQGTPSFIKKETARRAVVLLSAMPTHQLHFALCTLNFEKTRAMPGFYALWRLMAAAISSRSAVDGNKFSKYTFATPGCIRPRFGQYRPVSVPTGKIGNFNSCAKNINPRRSAGRAPGLTRVPSGKMINVSPFMIFVATRSVSFRIFVLPRLRFTGINPIRKNIQP